MKQGSRVDQPLGFKWCKLGTLGRVVVQLWYWESAFASALSFATLRLDNLKSAAPRLESAAGDATCLTALGMVGEPLLGGTGGLEEECRL